MRILIIVSIVLCILLQGCSGTREMRKDYLGQGYVGQAGNFLRGALLGMCDGLRRMHGSLKEPNMHSVN